MDKMKLYAVISPLCILFSQGIMPAQAQQLAGGKIQVESVLARKNGNRMDVAFRMNLNDLKMKSEQQIVFTPVMEGTDTIALNPIIIQGRNQAVRYRRLAAFKNRCSERGSFFTINRKKWLVSSFSFLYANDPTFVTLNSRKCNP